MKVSFISRNDCLLMMLDDHFLDNRCDLISISDTNKEKSLMKKYWLQRKSDENADLFLNFKDIEGVESRFTDAKAGAIIRFVEETFKKKKDLVVHCFAGVSRSGAVAKWVNDHYMLMDSYLSEYRGYNVHVYCVLEENLWSLQNDNTHKNRS